MKVLEEFSRRAKLLIGLGISGLLSLIGFGFRSLAFEENQWQRAYLVLDNATYQLLEGRTVLKWGAQFYYPAIQDRWFWMGTKLIYPLENLGNILILSGVGILLSVLLYAGYLRFHRASLAPA